MNLPNTSELSCLRNGLRKKKQPEVFNDLCGRGAGTCGRQLSLGRSGFHVEWSILGRDLGLEMQRFAFSRVTTGIRQVQGQKITDSIGHPTDLFNEARPDRDAADEPKHWATASARQMLGL